MIGGIAAYIHSTFQKSTTFSICLWPCYLYVAIPLYNWKIVSALKIFLFLSECLWICFKYSIWNLLFIILSWETNSEGSWGEGKEQSWGRTCVWKEMRVWAARCVCLRLLVSHECLHEPQAFLGTKRQIGDNLGIIWVCCSVTTSWPPAGGENWFLAPFSLN